MENFTDIVGEEAEEEIAKYLWNLVTLALESIGVRFHEHDERELERGTTPGYYFSIMGKADTDKVVVHPLQYKENKPEPTLTITVTSPLHYQYEPYDAYEYLIAVDHLSLIANVGLSTLINQLITEIKSNEIVIEERYELILQHIELFTDVDRPKHFERPTWITINGIFIFEIFDRELYAPPYLPGEKGGNEYEKVKRETKIGK